jgi:radical SAM superfamily enzyme YgiQ (UPF0313 family)
MKILLTAINAKYIHSNLAVYSLQAYVQKNRGITSLQETTGEEICEHQIEVAEFTINHRVDFILQEIYKKKPDVLLFSCYIWNFSYVCELIRECHTLMPQVPIWVGGPEVSYEYQEFLENYPMVQGIMVGEGEETFLELYRYYTKDKEHPVESLGEISGLVYKNFGKLN